MVVATGTYNFLRSVLLLNEDNLNETLTFIESMIKHYLTKIGRHVGQKLYAVSQYEVQSLLHRTDARIKQIFLLFNICS